MTLEQLVTHSENNTYGTLHHTSVKIKFKLNIRFQYKNKTIKTLEENIFFIILEGEDILKHDTKYSHI